MPLVVSTGSWLTDYINSKLIEAESISQILSPSIYSKGLSAAFMLLLLCFCFVLFFSTYDNTCTSVCWYQQQSSRQCFSQGGQKQVMVKAVEGHRCIKLAWKPKQSIVQSVWAGPANTTGVTVTGTQMCWRSARHGWHWLQPSVSKGQKSRRNRF